ncbi:hypothetical protein AB0F17_55235 [Nonomuraea sp. NPDC026600]|uniref:hypothetical protein n=1 Tax=Nonomuraea sp. NPDC026600 TaxID=3155363 RepID=UPI0033FC99C9
MTALERRYRRLLLAYPRQYRVAHGDELLDVLLDSAAPGQSSPVPREAWGLLLGGVRTRITHQAKGSAWADGLHLGITAVSAANLAALLPYTGSLPLWTLLSALALLAVMRGWVWPTLALTFATGVKAFAIAGGWPLLDLTLLPVYPSALTDRPLFETSSPVVVAAGYGVALSGLAVLIWRRHRPRVRSWWWFAAAVAASWAGPSWLPDETWFPISLSKMAVEVVALGLAVAGAYLARDPRWALAAGLYLLVTSGDLGLHADELTRQHLAYWGVLVVLTLATAFAPYRQRRHCLD